MSTDLSPKTITVVHGEPTLIGGLDPSTTRIGYSSPDGRMHSVDRRKLPAHPVAMDWARNCNEMRRGLERVIRLNPPTPDLMVVEAGMPSKFSTTRTDEMRGVLRDLLISWPTGPIQFVEVAPASVKLFACGLGSADKTKMTHSCISVIIRDGGRRPRNDDEADAFWLRRMGMAGCGLLEVSAEFQRDALRDCNVQWTVEP